MYHHNNNYAKALVDLFPDVNFDTFRFWAKGAFQFFLKCFSMLISYAAQSNRRKFFEEYAEENGFQVSEVEKWYSVPLEHIMATEVSKFSMVARVKSNPKKI
jgi:hypothetical protein